MRLFFLLLIAVPLTSGHLNVVTLKYCCGLGTNYANSGLKCEDFQTPISGIRKEDEASCLHSVTVCCNNRNQELQCDQGIADAKEKGSCSEDGFQKDCCDACKFGQEAAKTQNTCEDSLGLGFPYGKAFSDCCTDEINSPTTSTTTTTEKITTTALIKTTPANYLPLPPVENVCDIGDVCAQICIPTGDSYKCACNKGFTLMGDGISCKPDKRASKKPGDRCSVSNPCDHVCVDTGVAIKCLCHEGYELASDKTSCKDVDECALGTHECEAGEECVNDEGSYFCDDPNFKLGTDPVDVKCPAGYKFNYEKLVCDDIDECEFDIICSRPKTCINTIGSFECVGSDTPQCPPGFRFKDSIQTCTDIDECITGDNDCNKESQICVNTKGNYTCVDKVSRKTCPPGFKKNPVTQNCDDINECEENDDPCAPNEECVNEPGGHNCVPRNGEKTDVFPYPLRPPYEPSLPPKPTDQVSTAATETTSTTSTTTTKTTRSKSASCDTGYRFSTKVNKCVDIDECEEDSQLCDSNQDCYNSPGSYICNCKTGFTKDYHTGACVDINECQVGTHDCTEAQRCDNTVGSYLCARITGCGTGYTLNYANGLCEDDDECALGTHTCNSLGPNYKCRNTLGSYRCDSVRPIPRPVRPVPSPPNRPQLPNVPQWPPNGQQLPPNVPQSSPNVPQWPPNGQQLPPNVPQSSPNVPQWPPNGQQLPSNVPQSPNVPQLSSNVPQIVPTVPQLSPTPLPTQNYPIISDTRKKCLPGYFMNARGNCEDIDECQSNPCRRGQKCLNYNGRYQCISEVQCKIGYELDEAGESCVDINECVRGSHKCNPSQICKNGQGYYTCECPPGHHMNPATQRCEDIDECKFYRACSVNAECINTIGSYKCHCKEGFREKGNFCEDIDECKENAGLCEHSCVNIWGSYRCACRPGFILNYDNRTCTDIDECDKFKDKKLCIGTCENVPGSYKCKCPDGYRLGNDGRTCIDIDECQQKVCANSDDICLNTRGSYRCFTIKCPNNYFRDPQHKGRCKRPQSLCDPRDMRCILMPEQYTYHYITLVSNLPISNDNVQFFQINGPRWAIARADFNVKVVNVKSPYGVEPVNERFFKIVKPAHNTMQLYLVRSIQGPQEVELKVEMHLFQGTVMTANVVSHIFIVVSEYPF